MRRTLLLSLVLLAGCVPQRDDNDETRRAIERLRSDLARREPPVVNVPPPDFAPLLRELRKSHTVAKPQPRYTGARVHVDAQRGRCPPCELLKRDLARLVTETRWTVGSDESVHWQIVRHERPEFAVPRIEFVVDGQVVDVVEGYPHAPARAGYLGPIDALLRRHPAMR